MMTAIQPATEAKREMAEARSEHARSELVFAARVHQPNRYQLCRLVALATRKLHKPSDRIQDTINDVLVRLAAPHTEAGTPVPENDSASPIASGISIFRTAPSETQFGNSKWMPIKQAASTPERRGV